MFQHKDTTSGTLSVGHWGSRHSSRTEFYPRQGPLLITGFSHPPEPLRMHPISPLVKTALLGAVKQPMPGARDKKPHFYPLNLLVKIMFLVENSSLHSCLRFRSLEDECNWILSGMEAVPGIGSNITFRSFKTSLN